MSEILERPLVRTKAVATARGPVVGYREGPLFIFKGLRYAAPPVGELRFRPPAPLSPWREPAEAVSLGAPAIQAAIPPGEKTGGRSAGDPPAPGQPGTDEDCLFLNVWTQGLTGARPVMVWLHGGGFAAGSGGAAMYDGAALARRGDVVLVTVNHRLNVFGYLNLAELGGHPASGVAGMLDIVAALEWVRENIARFGGDPANVTIFGESGGGWKVSLLMAMPPARGLFHKAVVQSGPGVRAMSPETATTRARALLERLDVAPGDLSPLAKLPVTAIHAAAAEVAKDGIMMGFSPCLAADVLPAHPFEPAAPAQSADIPLMIGTNKDESTLFLYGTPRFGELTGEDLDRRARALAGDKCGELVDLLRKAFPDYSDSHLVAQVQTLGMFWMDSVRLAERKAAQRGAPVYMYRLEWETSAARGALRSPHALEIPLVFDNVEAARSFVGRGEAPQAMAELMAPAWLAFAHTGDPGVGSLPQWPAYETSRRATMVFDLSPRVADDPLSDIRRLLSS